MYIVYYQAVQLFLFLFSLFSLIFFAKLKNENSYVPWQVLYVSFVETLVYAIFCFAGRDLTIVNENIALFRYVTTAFFFFWLQTGKPANQQTGSKTTGKPGKVPKKKKVHKSQKKVVVRE